MFGIAEFYGIHIYSLIVNIQSYANKCTILESKAFTTEHYLQVGRMVNQPRARL
jgi:hypothetical protein